MPDIELPQPPPDVSPSYEQPNVLAGAERPAAAMPSEAIVEADPAGHRDPYAALRVPAFRRFAAAFVLSAVAAQIETAAVGWDIYSRTGSALDLGWLGLVLALPMLVLSLPAGQLADRFDRKKLFLFQQLSLGVCAVGLTIISWKFSHSPHVLGAMFTLLFIGAAGATIGRPSREAMMAGLVPTELYPNAVTWNSTSFELSSMGGPAIGGMIVWLASPAVAYAVTAMTLAISGALILTLPSGRAQSEPGSKPPASGFSDLLVGVRFVYRSKLLLAALTLDLFAVLFGGAVFLLPIFSKDILLVGALGFGFLRAASSIGAVSMAMLQAHLPPFKRAGLVLLATVTGFGMVTIVFGLSRSYALSFAMLVLTGAFDNISVVIRHSLVPLLTPDRMRGRVFAVNQIFVGSSNELGGLESGLSAWALGAKMSVVLGGLVSLGVVALVSIGFPQVRRLGSLGDVRPAED